MTSTLATAFLLKVDFLGIYAPWVALVVTPLWAFAAGRFLRAPRSWMLALCAALPQPLVLRVGLQELVTDWIGANGQVGLGFFYLTERDIPGLVTWGTVGLGLPLMVYTAVAATMGARTRG